MTQAASAYMEWISASINILLTAAIAWAGYRQYIVSRQLFTLQQSIENEKHRASIFLRIRGEITAGHSDAILQLTNLSAFAIWLESITVFLSNERHHEVFMQRSVLRADTVAYALRGEITELAGLKTPQDRANVTVWVRAKFWANDKWITRESERYSMSADRFNVQDVQLAN